jgi:glycosyltransferase involved in cell wall biosynthesis
LTVLEAISAGCYPLVSDIGGHRYIIDDDRFFFQKENVEDLRQKLKYLIKHKINDFKIDIKRFSWSNVIKDYISLLEN